MDLTPRAAQIYGRLMQAARQEQILPYGDVARWLSPPLDTHNPADRTELSHLLGEIGRYEHLQDRPLLPALVVYQETQIPGQGFFDLATELGLYGGSKDKDAQLAFFVRETNRVHAHWRRR